MIELEVPLGDRSYPVLVGAGARHRLLEVLPVGVRRAAVVTQASSHHGPVGVRAPSIPRFSAAEAIWVR